MTAHLPGRRQPGFHRAGERGVAHRLQEGALGDTSLAGLTAAAVPVSICPALAVNDGLRSPEYQPYCAGNGEAECRAADHVQRQVRADVHPRERDQHRRDHGSARHRRLR